MNYRTYTNEFKEKVVKEYLSGARLSDIIRKYELNKSQILRWKEYYKQTGTFPDGRGKTSSGRPKNIDISTMSKDEYIKYLEMENEILKLQCSLNYNIQK